MASISYTESSMDQLCKIVNGCRKNDRHSQQLLYERYYGYALKISFRYLDTYKEATELTNDTFLIIFRTLEDFGCYHEGKLDFHLTGWIKTKMIDALIHSLKATIDRYQPKMIPALSPTHQYMMSPDSPCLYCDMISAVRELPCILRTVFNLHVIDGYSQTEIAKMFGVSLQAVGCYIRIARLICIRTLLDSDSDSW
jgi:DNA-directed RNA polymerase specialized sigma24 family protein